MHRKVMGLKQRHVARLLGLHDTKPISLWEKGQAMPNSVNLIKLSIIYRTFPNELYYELFGELREELTALEARQPANQ
ncbi:hypothetical protein GCM10028826_18210 [Mucilaginibacter boryungensis]